MPGTPLPPYRVLRPPVTRPDGQPYRYGLNPPDDVAETLREAQLDAQDAATRAAMLERCATSLEALQAALVGVDGAVPPLTLTHGERLVGAVGGVTLRAHVAVTAPGTNTYVANDYVGPGGSCLQFPVLRAVRGTGVLYSCVLSDRAVQNSATELWLFSQPVNTPADSAAWTLTDEAIQYCLGVVPVSTYYASALNSVAQAGSVGLAVWSTDGTGNIYGATVTRGAPTYTTGDLAWSLAVLAD